MKKILIVPFLILCIYTESWYSVYQNAKRFYKEASLNEEKCEYGYAIKGQKTRDGFKGGYQDIIEAFEKSYFKPKLFKESEYKIKNIIENKITIKEGEEIFNRYFGKSNRYLDDIGLRVGKLLEKEDEEKAKIFYKNLLDAFPMNEKINEQLKNFNKEIIKTNDKIRNK